MDIIRGAGGIKGPVRKTITYANPGTGAGGTETDLFTRTGAVLVVALIPRCTTNLEQGGATPTLELGITNATDLFVASTIATAILADRFWVDTAPDADGVAIPAGLKDIAIEENISCKVAGTDDITAGVIEYTVYWLPISADGNLVAA